MYNYDAEIVIKKILEYNEGEYKMKHIKNMLLISLLFVFVFAKANDYKVSKDVGVSLNGNRPVFIDNSVMRRGKIRCWSSIYSDKLCKFVKSNFFVLLVLFSDMSLFYFFVICMAVTVRTELFDF